MDVYQQSTKLEGIDEIWELMEKVIGESYHEFRGTDSHKLLWAKGDCINKVVRKKQNKTWDPGKLQTMQHDNKGGECYDNMSGQQQHKIWDPGGLWHRNT
jgi:hypothetical protein